MTLSIKARVAQEQARALQLQAQKAALGFKFGVFWRVDEVQHGPGEQYRTFEDALAERDRIFRENDKPIPMEYYDRQARLIRFSVCVRRFVQRTWEALPDTSKSGVWDIRYVD